MAIRLLIKRDERTKRLYAVAVYLIVAAVAIILLLIGLRIASTGTAHDLLINLAADFLAVVLIFFLVNQFFLLDPQEKLSERVQYLLDRIEHEHGVLLPLGESNRQFALKEQLPSAKTVDLLGYNLADVLYRFRSDLINCIKNGAEVRILLTDHNGPAGNLMCEHAEVKRYPHDYQKSFESIHNISEQTISNSKRRFYVHLTTWIPSCSMIIINRKEDSGEMKVTINHPHFRTQMAVDRGNLLLKAREEPTWFKYFVEQYESLWEHSKPCKIDINRS